MADDALDAPFRKPVLIGLVAVAASSLALAVAMAIFQPNVAVESVGPSSFSHSALGHSAFTELLRARSIPVMVSRYASAERAGTRGLLLLAEPAVGGDEARERRLRSMVGSSRHVLLVLPKWRGVPDQGHPGWISGVQRLPLNAADTTLSAAGVAATVVAPATLGPCDVPSRLALVQPQLLKIHGDTVRPLISCGEGVLLAEVARDGRQLLVLADPDVIENHGLGVADHAALALDAVERVRPAGQTVVVDETLHGHERVPSLWRELFTFPLALAVLQGALALAALIWSGLGRFGAPLPAPPPFASGKTVLIDNTAALMRSAGHSAYALGRYFEAAVADVERGLHAPVKGTPALAAWLRGHARGRRPGLDLADVQRAVENAQRVHPPVAAVMLSAARRIHRWRQELLRGPEEHPGR